MPRASNPFGKNNKLRLLRTLLQEAQEDRQLALAQLEYFKKRVEDNPADNEASRRIPECLKLTQTAKQMIVKLLELTQKEELSMTKTHKKLPEKGQVLDYNAMRGSVGKPNDKRSG